MVTVTSTTCVFCLIFVGCCLSSVMESKNCKTETGISGFCRHIEDCASVNEVNKLSSDCSNMDVCCPETGISKRKCYEYGDAVYGLSEALPLMGSVTNNDIKDECGIVAVPLIVGGEKAQSKEFPHMAAIGYGNDPENAKWLCGGSLISELYILTAAHCLSGYHGKARFVKMGVTNIQSNENGHVQLLSIEKHVPHPRYSDTRQTDDIALLKLNKRVELTPFVRPACLNYEGVTKQSALAAGWGDTMHGALKGNADLMKVQLDEFGKSECDKVYSRTLKWNMSNAQSCFGSRDGKKDTCQGDSGGPLNIVKKEPYCMYSVIGITSIGKFCGFDPAIYTSVFYYVPWLESVVWPSDE